jgi:ribonuclease T1
MIRALGKRCPAVLLLFASIAIPLLAMWGCGNGSKKSSETSASPPEATSALLSTGKSIGDADAIKSADLPPEAHKTIQLIKRGGPFPYAKDGAVFGNREGLLIAKPQGYYREYTVITSGARDRGARRIIVGKNGEYYYTDDHYRSFKRIRE